MTLGLAASGGPDLALTSTQAVCYIAAVSGFKPAHGRTDDARLAAQGGSDLALTSTPAVRFIAADGAANLRTDAQAALELAITDGSPHRAA